MELVRTTSTQIFFDFVLLQRQSIVDLAFMSQKMTFSAIGSIMPA